MDNPALSRDLLGCLPHDPLEMLATANQIAMHAYTQRVQQLEAENSSLRSTFTKSTTQIKALEKRCMEFEVGMRETQDKLTMVTQERDLMANEKNALISTVKRLNRDITNAESLKLNLIKSLQDGTPLHSEDYSTLSSPMKSVPALEGPTSPTRTFASRGAETPPTAARTPLLTMESPYTSYTNRFASTTPSPYLRSATLSASSKYQSSTPGGGMGTPSVMTPSSTASPLHRSPGGRVDGKEFFRQARARLAQDCFSKFLQNIKELNAHKKSHEEALQTAKELLTDENDDLYQAFESMIGRHIK